MGAYELEAAGGSRACKASKRTLAAAYCCGNNAQIAVERIEVLDRSGQPPKKSNAAAT